MRSFITSIIAALLVLPAVASAEEAQSTGKTLPTAPIPLPVLAPGCPTSNLGRTPQQVWEQHLAALAAGDFERGMCDYAWDARVVMAGTVIRGWPAVRQGFLETNQMMGGGIPEMISVDINGEIVLTTWTIQTPYFSIPDGSDTFVIRFGLIHYQTMHAPMVFNAPPAP
ncbi:MAG: hypothetical protein WBV82_29230 [Myxococcaceae bacterium]